MQNNRGRGWRYVVASVIGIAGISALAFVGFGNWGSRAGDASASGLPAGIKGQMPTGPGADFQAAILADGHVTDAEYQEARGKVNACLQAAGLQPTSLDDPVLNNAAFGWTVPGDGDVDAAMHTAEDCARDYFDQVQLQYRNQGADVALPLGVREGEIAQCLSLKGIFATPPFSATVLQQLMDDPASHQAFVDCQNARN